MLEGEDRRRREDRDLHPLLRRLERRAQRDLGLAEADVAAEQPVHRPPRLEVSLDVGEGRALVRRQVVRERLLELALPDGVGAAGVGPRRAPPRVELQQLLGHLLDRRADLAAPALPPRAAEPVERRDRVPGAAVLLDQVEARHRHVELVAGGVLDEEHLLAGRLAAREAEVSADAVVHVDDEVAELQVAQVGDERLAAAPLARGRRRRIGAEEVRLGEDERAVGAELDPFVERAGEQRDLARIGGKRRVLVGAADADPRVAQHLLQPVAAARRAGEQHDRPPRGRRAAHVVHQRLEPSLVAAGRTAVQIDVLPHAVEGRRLGDLDRRRLEPRQRGGERHVEFGRRRETVARHLAVGGPQVVPAGLELLADLLRRDDDEAGRREVERRDEVGAVEARRPFESGEQLLGQLRQPFLGRLGLGEQVARAADEPVEQRVGLLGADRGLARREQAEAVDARHGPLRAGIEAPHRLDLVPEQFDAQRRVLLRRPDVEEAAAAREVAGAADDVHHAVAGAHREARRLLHRQDRAGAHVARPRGDGRGARHGDEQRGGGNDDDDPPAAREAVEDGDAPRGGRRVGRHAAVGVGVERGKAERLDAGERIEKRGELRLELARRGVVRDDGEERAVHGLGQRRDGHRPGQGG